MFRTHFFPSTLFSSEDDCLLEVLDKYVVRKQPNIFFKRGEMVYVY